MKQRYHLLDSFRGILLLNMIACHALWDMIYLFGFHAAWYRETPGELWQWWISGSFILLSGFCWGMGRHQAKRGFTVFLSGALVSVVTLILLPSSPVLFGVLTLLGSCMLLLIPLSRLFDHISPFFGGACSFLIYLLLRGVPDGEILCFGQTILTLPNWLYQNHLTAYFGFPHPGFRSSDYFPLLPHLFLFLAGYFLYRATKDRLPRAEILTRNCPPLSFLGRHSLIFYLLHQPVIYAILMLLY